ncbi:histidine kinase N-terminal 7TM domain-containing protein [Cohnella cellulosilytica]|uniref:histidine kinase n=1 Tax=Cohnella cellulosilytica TaxID=986710 RepID=A0ABW2F875_9BACL
MDIKQWMSILLFIATAIMLFISWVSYRKRHLPVVRTMIVLMLAAAFYAFGYALEVLSRNLNEFKLSLQIEYLGIPFVSTLWLILVIQFTGAAAGYRKRLTVALMIVPACVFGFHLTNDWHHLVYERYILNTDTPVPLYTTVKGIWYKVHMLYNYSVMLCGLLLFIPMYLRSLPATRKQIVVLALGAAAPMLLNAVFFFGVAVDLTPFGFVLSGIAYVWGIYRFNLLRLMPLAQAKIFDTIRDGVIVIDGEDRIVNFNRSALSVLSGLGGASRYPEHAEKVLAGYPELLANLRDAGSGESRFPFRRLDGERLRHYHCSVTPIQDSDEMPLGKILMFNEITELKENESRLREKTRQLAELNAFKDKLFTVVAHDIRDPIALLVSLTELLGEERAAVDREHDELFLELKEQVRSTFQLVEHLLDWYRSQKGQVQFRPMSWNLQQVVRQALSLARAKADMKRIAMTESVGEQLVVQADKEMLDLILRNLLANAIKYTGIGGAIEIGAALENGAVVVAVRDNGTGIDPHVSEQLQMEQPFFKPSSSEDDSANARFGLVLAREFLRIHGGRLWFHSVPGKGTTFYFSLTGAAGGRIPFTDAREEASL